jgi:cysteine desulfurase
MPDFIYLDHAAATPMDTKVLAAMQPYFATHFYNPSASYLPAQKVKKDVETARSAVAQLLGARPSEIVFTAGGTEANNLAIYGVMSQQPKGNIVISAIEHESVLEPAAQHKHKLAPVDSDGRVNLAKLEKLIDDHTVLVSVMYANNEIGTIEPIREIAQIIKRVRSTRRAKGNQTPIYLHTDACQAGAYLDLHVSRLGVDMMSLNGGKIYGPKQSGVLYVKAGIALKPQVLGGGQERSLRSGTENVAGIVGFAKALELAQANRQDESKRLERLRMLFIELIQKQIPKAQINGSLKHRLPNNIHITIPGYDNERLLIQLEQRGVLAAAGSACSASNEEPSHVLTALGLSEADARASLRFSMGRDTKAKDIEKTVKALKSSL